jgi:hypothetical protein
MTGTARPGRGSLRLLPESMAGRCALALFGVAVVACLLITAVGTSGAQAGLAFSETWLLAVPACVAGLSEFGSTAVGGYAILRRHEHAGLVFLTTAVGVVVAAFVLGETFRPW